MTSKRKHRRLGWRIELGVALLALCGARGSAAAGEGAPKIFRIWPGDLAVTAGFDQAEAGETVKPDKKPGEFTVKGITRAWLADFQPAAGSEPFAAVIICPGGGYSVEALSGEGSDVARRYNADGIAAFVLKYRLPHGRPPAEGTLPLPEQDVLRAVQFVRANAKAFNVDPHRVGVVGFSAGGHVAGLAATAFADASQIKTAGDDPVARASARPDFAILLYPVVSMDFKVGKSRSAPNLLGPDRSQELMDRYSTDKRLTAATPPLFIMHAMDDKTISYHHSEHLAAAAKRAGVSCEFELIHHDGHAFGLGTGPESKTWYPKSLAWLAAHDLYDKP